MAYPSSGRVSVTWMVVAFGSAAVAACGNPGSQTENQSTPDNRIFETEGLVANGVSSAERSFQVQNTGDPVSARDYPWQVGLIVAKNGKWYRCGGTLVTPQFVLTAAHCLDKRLADSDPQMEIVGAQDIEVYHGYDDFSAGPRLAVDPNWAPRLHRDWKSNFSAQKYLYDAAIFRLAQPVAGATVAPVRSEPISSRNAIVSGWGRFTSTSEASNELRAVAVTTIDNATCAQQLPAPERNWIANATLCTRNARDDACSGDSGGPLVIGSRARPQLVGIVSWGLRLPCATPGPSGALIGAYTRASALAQWVANETGDPASVTSAAPDPLMSVNSRPGQGGIVQ